MQYDGNLYGKIGNKYIKLKQNSNDVDNMAKEIKRLQEICQNTHDRLLRGDSDVELMEMLEKAWKEKLYA